MMNATSFDGTNPAHDIYLVYRIEGCETEDADVFATRSMTLAIAIVASGQGLDWTSVPRGYVVETRR